MKKKVTTINLDMDIWEKSRREFPSLSEFVNSVLRSYFSNDDFMAVDIQRELDKIKEAQVNIHLLTLKQDESIKELELSDKQLNNAWLSVWSRYRNGVSVDDAEVEDVCNILNVSIEYLLELVEVLLSYAEPEQLSECDSFRAAERFYLAYKD